MKRHLILGVLTALTIQSIAHAEEIVVDLPNFDTNTSTQTPAPPPPPIPQRPSVQPTNPQTQYSNSVTINGVSRKSGGTLYKIDLLQPISLQLISLTVNTSQINLISVVAINDYGQRIRLGRLSDAGVLQTGTTLTSDYLTQGDRIARIEVLAEAYGAEATITVGARADRDVPKLVYKEERPTAPVQPPPAPQRPPVDKTIRAGDMVMSGPFSNGAYYAGQVLETYSNGKVLVRDTDDGKKYVRDLNIVAKRVSCESTKGLCEGRKVLSGPFINDQYYTGMIMEVYSNGKLRVQDIDDGKLYMRDANIISTELRCDSAGNCVGDNVLSGPFINNAYFNGKIEMIYSNGLIRVIDNDDGKPYYRKANIVLKSVRCDEKSRLCIGDQVLSGPFTNDEYYNGKIEGVYSNGLIYVRDNDDGKLYGRQASIVRKPIRCESSKGICIGDRVVSGPYRGGYYAGRVVGVYSSTLIRVQDDDDGKTYTRAAKELAKAQ